MHLEQKGIFKKTVDSEKLQVESGSEDLIMQEHQLSNWKNDGLLVHSSREMVWYFTYSCLAAIFFFFFESLLYVTHCPWGSTCIIL